MPIELKVPAVGESITEVEIGAWLKAKGARVEKDEPVVTLESDKATVELPAPVSGTLTDVLKQKGDTAKVGEVIGYLTQDGKAENAPQISERRDPNLSPKTEGIPRVMPAAQRVLAEKGMRAEEVKATGPGGRLLKEDALRQGEQATTKTDLPGLQKSFSEPEKLPGQEAEASRVPGAPEREEEVVPMSRLRRTLAERLVQAQRTAALLTTFNEIDMSAVIALRKDYGEVFQQKYNVKLGFMSFFAKASIEALKLVPQVNAEVRGTDIVYRNYYDVGVAIGAGKGLVVPVLRNAERMSFAEIEMAIGDFARRAQENKLKLEELQGGTFTISNGGVYGSLLSTPIVNPPQSGVLGMHAIQDRPVAREGHVVIRPMMYVALTYDHRIVDGREAVAFLKRIKEIIESPARMLIEV